MCEGGGVCAFPFHTSLFWGLHGFTQVSYVHADLCSPSHVGMSPCLPGSAPILACVLPLHTSAQYIHRHRVTPLHIGVARHSAQNCACRWLSVQIGACRKGEKGTDLYSHRRPLRIRSLPIEEITPMY